MVISFRQATSMETRHPLIIAYHDSLLGFTPTSYARMNTAGSARKYTKVHRSPSLALIQAHLRGDITIAVPLIDAQGRARAAVLDVDEGGVGGVKGCHPDPLHIQIE